MTQSWGGRVIFKTVETTFKKNAVGGRKSWDEQDEI